MLSGALSMIPRQKQLSPTPWPIKITLSCSSMTFLSRIVGFIRDIILAQFFGVSVHLMPSSLLLKSLTSCAVCLVRVLFLRLLCLCWSNVRPQNHMKMSISLSAGRRHIGGESIIIVLAEIAAPLLILVLLLAFT